MKTFYIKHDLHRFLLSFLLVFIAIAGFIVVLSEPLPSKHIDLSYFLGLKIIGFSILFASIHLIKLINKK